MNFKKNKHDVMVNVKQELKAKLMGVSKVRAITIDWLNIDSILLDPAIPEIFYVIHDLGASLIKILCMQKMILKFALF